MTSNRVPHESDARDLGAHKRLEKALQASEERFRTLVQLSFDVYWETDAEHRFTRQDFAPTLLNAPAPDSEIGKTRWEVPYLEPDEEAWSRHRATLDAHLPLRDFELARPTAGGGTRHVSVSGFPVFDEDGRFLGYRGVGRDITQRKRAEAQRRAHLWFLQSMDRISRAMQGTHDLERMLRDVLGATIDVFSCDRVWLLHPCDPQLTTWQADMERTRPPFPAALASGTEVAGSDDMSAAFTAAQASGDPGPVLPALLADRYGIRSHMAMALQAREDHPYLLCLHQCSQARNWTDDEKRLFREIGGRLADALRSLLAIRNLRDSERRLEAAQRIAHVGWWERDYASGRVSLSDESSRIFGVEPVDMPQWHGRWLGLIHPDDRAKAAAASDAALQGGPRYDVEYRVLRPDGTLRMVHSQGDVTSDKAGRAIRQFGVMQDITELWQAQQELRARQDMLDLAQKAARAVAFDWHIGARESENRWSSDLEAMYGLATGTFDRTFQGWKKLVHPDDWPAVKLAITHANESGDVAAEYRVIHEGGTVHWLQAKGRMLFDAERRPERMVGFMIDVTDRRHAEEELRATEARFRTFVDHATDAFFLLDDQSTVIDVNRQACMSLGYSREQLIGMHPRQFDAGLDRPSLARIMERIGKGEAVTFETLHRRSDGTMFPVEVRARQFLHGEKRLYASLVRDTSERKRAEQDLRASEARFRTFVDRATDAFFLLDEQVRVVDVNRQACDSLGWSREELIGMHPREFDVALDEASIEGLAQRAAAGEIITFETRHRRKDGTTFPVEIRTGTFRQAGELFSLGLARDITERKLAEESLRQSEAYLTEAQRLSHTGSWALDVATNRYVYTSEEFDRLFGFDRQAEAPTREAVLERMHPDDRISWKRILEKSVGEKVDTTSQYRILLPDGRVRHIHTIRHPVLDSTGKVVRLVGTSIDITDRKRGEEELRASEARFRTFVDRATDAFFLLDDQSTVIDVNRQACEGLGYARDELIGMHPRDFDAALDEQSISRLAQRAGAGETITFETRHRRRDGTVFPVEIRSGMFRQGDRMFYLALARDITERKLVEERLREQEHALQTARTELAHVSRLTTLGELTSSIAHEVSQPLGGMITSAGACARWLAANPPDIAEARAALDNIAADGKRAREVIARIRALTKRQLARKDRLDINHEVLEVLALTKHEVRSHDIVVRTQLDTTLPRVVGDRVQLQQVLLNLIVNAIEAMSAVCDRPRLLTMVSGHGSPNTVLVEVGDSGIGLDPGGAERVFEAFYTTKTEGIGIGLSISRSIVEAHGGRLWASPNEPHGAVFRLSLPFTEERTS